MWRSGSLEVSSITNIQKNTVLMILSLPKSYAAAQVWRKFGRQGAKAKEVKLKNREWELEKEKEDGAAASLDVCLCGDQATKRPLPAIGSTHVRPPCGL